jgi:hypothetical protein
MLTLVRESKKVAGFVINYQRQKLKKHGGDLVISPSLPSMFSSLYWQISITIGILPSALVTRSYIRPNRMQANSQSFMRALQARLPPTSTLSITPTASSLLMTLSTCPRNVLDRRPAIRSNAVALRLRPILRLGSTPWRLSYPLANAIWAEAHHPHVPKVAEILEVLRSMTAEERNRALDRAGELENYGRVFQEAMEAFKK